MAENKRITDRLVDALFSKDKTLLYLILLAVLGFVLRTVAAININVTADDMHFAPGAINFLSSGKLEYWDQSAGLWFAVTDIFYKIMGATQLASRFSGVLFGTLLIFVVFLVAKEFFKDNKIALIASFLVAISPFHIRSMMAEMDVMAMFFVFLSLFFFAKALNNQYNKKFLLLSAVSLGLSIYTKVYTLLFIPGMLIFWFYKNREKTAEKKGFYKTILLFLAVIFIFCLPALTHNYLLYKEKGILDHQFTRTLGLGDKEMYSWMAGGDSKADYVSFFLGRSGLYNGLPTSLLILKWLFIADPIVFVLGIIGLILLWKRKDFLLLTGLLFILPFFYLASVMLLIKHYLFATLLLTIPAAFTLEKSSKFIRLRYLMLLIIIFSAVYLGFANQTTGSSIYEKSTISQLMEFKAGNIDPDSLVIVDSRVYRGQMTWIFSDRHYLEASYLSKLFEMQQNKTGISTNVYFIECARDDCGWGTIYNQPEFNASMEDIVGYFKNISMKQAVIQDSFGEYFTVYKTALNLAPGTLAAADSTHTWWLYPLGYNQQISKIFDDYTPKSFFDILLNNIAHLIRYFSVFAAILSILVAFYYTIKELS